MKAIIKLSDLSIAAGLIVGLITCAGLAEGNTTNVIACLMVLLISAGAVAAGVYGYAYVNWKEAEADRMRRYFDRYGHSVRKYR